MGAACSSCLRAPSDAECRVATAPQSEEAAGSAGRSGQPSPPRRGGGASAANAAAAAAAAEAAAVAIYDNDDDALAPDARAALDAALAELRRSRKLGTFKEVSVYVGV